jgi:Tfp pilus assembly protein PilX
MECIMNIPHPYPAIPAGSALPTLTGPARQGGMALFIALIALVTMTLSAIALMRSVDTTNLVAGNLAFKQGATLAGDAGIEAGRTLLIGWYGSTTLDTNNTAEGYYATDQSTLDITGRKTPTNPADNVDWDGTNSSAAVKAKILPEDSAGNRVSYVVHRLCTQALTINDPNNSCLTEQQSTSAGSTKGGAGYGQKPLSGKLQVYYRVTARIAGPRNSTSYVQAIILL